MRSGKLLLPVIGSAVEFQGVKANVMGNSRRPMVSKHTGEDVNWPQGLMEEFFSKKKVEFSIFYVILLQKKMAFSQI